MSNPTEDNGAFSIYTVASNVTMGPMQQPLVDSEHVVKGKRRRKLFPKFAGVCLVLPTLCNPVLGILAILAYLRARRGYKDDHYLTAGQYLALSFIFGIIGISMTILTVVAVYIYNTQEDVVLVADKVVKAGNLNITKAIGFRQGKYLMRKTKNEQMQEEAYPYEISSPDRVRLVGVVFETSNSFNVSNEHKGNDKTNMNKILDTMMRKGNSASPLLELNGEIANATKKICFDSSVVKDFEVLNSDRSVRDTAMVRRRDRALTRRKRMLNSCRQLKLLLKGSSIKVRMKIKYALLGWKPIVVEITDHTDCLIY
ncbi:uncharacterized protein LOC117330922 [Pecten maximus]|uniref:uncharacterized protein LOC117330922 n=1 Tax=Pecten maximus TaxID=6579 RepID=UPI001458BAFA|nr:uncharacterized protein LOC117330922 [Pecten maximus]